jgi:hypothetical protein
MKTYRKNGEKGENGGNEKDGENGENGENSIFSTTKDITEGSNQSTLALRRQRFESLILARSKHFQQTEKTEKNGKKNTYTHTHNGENAGNVSYKTTRESTEKEINESFRCGV